MNVCEHLTASATLFPCKDAIVFEGQRFTFAEVNALSIQAAQLLCDAGVTRGDRVAIVLPNVPAFVVWYYAALRVGAIAVSVSTRLADQEVAFVLSDCEAKAFVAIGAQLKEHLKSLAPCVAKSFAVSESGDSCDGKLLARDCSASTWLDAEPNEPAVILYTSGTTGFAKGATLSHMNVRSNVHAFNHLCQMRTSDRILLAVPLFHCFGQNALLNSAFNVGATIILQRKFDLTETKQLIAEQQVTQLYGVPTMFQLLQESCAPDNLASVQYCFSAAAPLPIQVSQRWQEKFDQPIHEGYGLTETSPFASYNHRLQYVMGSIGTPIDAVEMRIVNTETGAPCPAGELGEIAIRGPNVMLGYWNRPDDTATAIRDGWFHTGDIGRTDERGFFYIVDRVKDMISVGGLKVYPAEVERVLLDHVAVSEIAVLGVFDDVLGERVIAFVVSSEPTSADEGQLATDITQYAHRHLAHYKVPQQIVFIDELPRNPAGKVLKTSLREFEVDDTEKTGSRAATAGSTPPLLRVPVRVPTLRSRLEETHVVNRQRVAIDFLQDTVRSLTGSDELPDCESTFLDAGLDSLMIVEMSRWVQDEIGTGEELSPTLIFDYPRICDLADFLVAALTPAASVDKAQPPARVIDSTPALPKRQLGQEVASMTEDEALDELMREIAEE